MAAPLVVAEDVDNSNEEEIDEQASYRLPRRPPHTNPNACI